LLAAQSDELPVKNVMEWFSLSCTSPFYFELLVNNHSNCFVNEQMTE